jgi:hypothetical protein
VSTIVNIPGVSIARQHIPDDSVRPSHHDTGGGATVMPKMCEDSTEGDIHAARTEQAKYCEYHRLQRRSLSSMASDKRAAERQRGEDITVETPKPTGPRPVSIRATAPAAPIAADGSEIVIAIRRKALNRARAAFAREEEARNAYTSDPGNRSKAATLVAASLSLSQAVEAILHSPDLPQ